MSDDGNLLQASKKALGGDFCASIVAKNLHRITQEHSTTFANFLVVS